MENSKSIFDNMTTDEFDELLDKFGFEYTKVKKGEGGLLYKGKVYKTYKEYEEQYRKDNS